MSRTIRRVPTNQHRRPHGSRSEKRAVESAKDQGAKVRHRYVPSDWDDNNTENESKAYYNIIRTMKHRGEEVESVVETLMSKFKVTRNQALEDVRNLYDPDPSNYLEWKEACKKRREWSSAAVERVIGDYTPDNIWQLHQVAHRLAKELTEAISMSAEWLLINCAIERLGNMGIRVTSCGGLPTIFPEGHWMKDGIPTILYIRWLAKNCYEAKAYNFR